MSSNFGSNMNFRIAPFCVLLFFTVVNCLKSENIQISSIKVLPPRGSGFWSVKGVKYYDAYGREVFFSGVNWSGFESPGTTPDGLYSRSYSSILDQMKSLGFNLIRLGFAGQTLKPNVFPTSINFWENKDLQGLNCLRVMDKIINAAAKRNIKIILDYHRKVLTAMPEDGLWFDDKNPESLWINNWVMLAKRYANQPAVIGFDLFNEVHNNTKFVGYPVWNTVDKSKYNFRTAVQKVVNAIQNVNKKAILFVPGMWYDSWWGGSLIDVVQYPIKSKIPGKIAYSAHDYGPIVHEQPWHNVKNYPQNLPQVWQKRWGFVVDKSIAPVWIGEFGSFYRKGYTDSLNRRENLWVEKLRDYIRAKKLSWTWFTLGPNSGDTGGIFQQDWKNVNTQKLKLLAPIMHPNFGPSPGQ